MTERARNNYFFLLTVFFCKVVAFSPQQELASPNAGGTNSSASARPISGKSAARSCCHWTGTAKAKENAALAQSKLLRVCCCALWKDAPDGGWLQRFDWTGGGFKGFLCFQFSIVCQVWITDIFFFCFQSGLRTAQLRDAGKVLQLFHWCSKI